MNRVVGASPCRLTSGETPHTAPPGEGTSPQGKTGGYQAQPGGGG